MCVYLCVFAFREKLLFKQTLRAPKNHQKQLNFFINADTLATHTDTKCVLFFFVAINKSGTKAKQKLLYAYPKTVEILITAE